MEAAAAARQAEIIAQKKAALLVDKEAQAQRAALVRDPSLVMPDFSSYRWRSAMHQFPHC